MAVKTRINKGSQKAQWISNPNGYDIQPRLYDLNKAAYYLGRSVYSLRTLIWNGEIPIVKSGKKQWLDIMDLNKWIDNNKETVTG